MVKSANRDRVLVGDLPSERARLGETNVMRFARNSAADDARLCRNVFAVELVTQPNCLWSEASVSCTAHRWQNRRRWIRKPVVSEDLLSAEADRLFGRIQEAGFAYSLDEAVADGRALFLALNGVRTR